MSIISTFPIGTSSGSSGGSSSKSSYSVGTVSDVRFTTGIKSMTLSWTDPADLICDDQAVKWAGTKVVYREGSVAPRIPEEGTLAINSTTCNSYATTPLEISGLAGDKDYAVNIFHYTNDGVTTTGMIPSWSDFVQGDIFTTLNNNSWGTIREVSDAGTAANYWKVGDTKTIVIDGKVGNTTLSNLSVDVFIIGFNHNATIEGNNRIHFQIGKIGKKSIGVVDSEYCNNQSSFGYFQMNLSPSNTGGWSGSYMRQTILGNSNTPTNPLTNSLMAALPSDLRPVIKDIIKYTDNTGGGKDIASNVTTTKDYLFLLASYEVLGSRGLSNSTEQKYQLQYDYYKTGNSRISYNYNTTNVAIIYWLRSPRWDYNGYFCLLSDDGSIKGNLAHFSYGIVACFTV